MNPAKVRLITSRPARISRRRFVARAASIAAGAAAACGLPSIAAAMPAAPARPAEPLDDGLHNVAEVLGEFRVKPAVIPPPLQLPPVFRLRLSGQNLMAPEFPEGCIVELRTLSPGEAVNKGDAALILSHDRKQKFARVGIVRRDAIVLTSTNPALPRDYFKIAKGEIAAIAVATAVVLPIEKRAHKKSDSRETSLRPKPASNRTKRAMAPTAA